MNIDLGAIHQNCGAIRSHIGNRCHLCAVVKADGYGLGALRVASQLQQHSDLLAVYSPEEAGELLIGGIKTPILILAPIHTVDRHHPVYRGLTQGLVHLVVHGMDHLRSLILFSKHHKIEINLQVKIDTGLHRGGCALNEAKTLIESIIHQPSLYLTGLMTHFASAVHDEKLTRLQHDRFKKVIQSLSVPLPRTCFVHEANTAATAQWNWTHQNMVRVGLAWTGTVPDGVPPLKSTTPVLTWRTRLAHIRHVQEGEQVGYSGTWRATRPSRIGIVPVGYASGYPIGVGEDESSSGAFVRVYDEQFKTTFGDAPVIGCVCMDQFAIDLTDVPDRGVGCGIELISTDQSSKATLSEIAKAARVAPHAIISRISPNVHRTYIDADAVGQERLVSDTRCQTLGVRH